MHCIKNRVVYVMGYFLTFVYVLGYLSLLAYFFLLGVMCFVQKPLGLMNLGLLRFGLSEEGTRDRFDIGLVLHLLVRCLDCCEA